MVKEKEIDMENSINKEKIFSIIESLLFVSGDPLKISDLSNILECSKGFLENVIMEMKDIYESEERGINIVKVNDTYQLVTKKENSRYVEKLLNVNASQSLSQASLEVLAIIAYKQPITRIEIEEIRGVKSDSAINTLMEKALIKEGGRKDIVGRPILYNTTKEFLKHFELEDLKQLPNIEQLTFDVS